MSLIPSVCPVLAASRRQGIGVKWDPAETRSITAYRASGRVSVQYNSATPTAQFSTARKTR
jgi:hypothetical protein